MGCGNSKDTGTPVRQAPMKKGPRSKSQDGREGSNLSSTKTTPKHKAFAQKKETHIGDAGHDRGPPKGIRRHSDHSQSYRVQSPAEYYAPTAYENENLPMEGDWEVEKGVDETTPITDTSYPLPKPGKPISDKIDFSHVDYEIMKNSDQKQAAGTFEEVARMLTRGLTPEIVKVRALVTWMCCQKIRTRQYGADAKPGTVMGYMKQMKEGKGTFAGLLTNLCRAINIPCIIIKGLYKSSGHQVGEDDVKNSRSTWNAVYVDNNWQIVHPYLICTPLETKTPRGELKLLQSSSDENQQNPGFILNTFFFAPKPSDFIFCCIPDEIQSYWQLMDVRMRYPQFLNLPFLRPAFFSNNMILKSDSNSVLTAKNGMCMLKIKCDEENINNISMMYELYTYDQDLQEDPDWGELVFYGRNEDTYYVQVKFPVAGTFKISLYGRMCDWFFWLCDFKIICDAPMAKYTPSPTVSSEVGWGPSQLTRDAGLLAPSHEGGIIFYKTTDVHILKFHTHKKMTLQCRLLNNSYDPEELEQYCRVCPRKCEIDIVVKLAVAGEFVLAIDKEDDEGEQTTNVCNYFFVDWDDGRKREDVFQRKARTELREAAASHDHSRLEAALQNFRSRKLSEADDDYLRAQRRLKYLTLKKLLREGRMRRNEAILTRAIDEAESSTFQHALQPNIDKARRMLVSLQSLEMHCHPVMQLDHKTIAEIANYTNPPHDVHQTMIATYLLLGEEKKALQKWGYIQSLLRKVGREGIQARITQFHQQEMPPAPVIQATQEVYDKLEKPYILSASLSATSFYDWVSGVIGCLGNNSQNAISTADTSYDETDDVTLYIKDSDDTLSQDEGFLDSHEMEANTRDSNQT